MSSLLNEPEKSGIVIDQCWMNYDPPVTRVTLEEGNLKKGHYIPELGIIEHVWEQGENDELKVIEEASPNKKAYIVQTRVTEDGFPLLPKDLQSGMISQMEKRLANLKEAFEKWKNTEKVTLENLYENPTDYRSHLSLPEYDPTRDPVRQAYLPHPSEKKKNASNDFWTSLQKSLQKKVTSS